MTRGRGARGSLLIVTLWLITILSALAIAVGRYLSLELKIAKYHTARKQAAALARGGVYLAMARLADDGAEEDSRMYDWLGDDDWARWTTPDPQDPETGLVALGAQGMAAPRGVVRIRTVDEERKVSLNGLPGAQDVWFNAAGALLQSPTLAAAIEDYADSETPPLPSHGQGLEFDEASNPRYLAKNGPLAAPEELWEIPGVAAVPAEVLAAFLAQTSVYTAQPMLNINTVSPEVLAAMGLSEQNAQGLADCRERGTIFTDKAEIWNTAVDHGCLATPGAQEQALLTNHFDVVSNTFTISSEGRLEPSGVSVRMEAVVKREGSGARPRILAWRER